MIRGYGFSLGVAPVNLLTISIAALVTTAMQKGMSPELAVQATRAIGLMFSLGMLLLWLLASLVAFGGWLLVRLSDRGRGRIVFFAAGVLIAALLPAIFSLFVLGLPLGVSVVLVTTGLFAAAMRGAPEAKVVPHLARAAAARPTHAGFGRRA